MRKPGKSTLIATGAVSAALVVGVLIGSAGTEAPPAAAAPAPTVTVTRDVPGPTTTVASDAAPRATVTKEVKVPGPTKTVRVKVPGPTVTVTGDKEPVQPSGDTCGDVREAILTGTQSEIETAMAALVADTSADGTAREYARYYLIRDAGDPDLQEMDISLIQMSCEL